MQNKTGDKIQLSLFVGGTPLPPRMTLTNKGGLESHPFTKSTLIVEEVDAVVYYHFHR